MMDEAGSPEEFLTQSPRRANYLTRLARYQDRRKWPRRKCNVIVGVLYLQKGLRQLSLAQIRLLDISEGGAFGTSRCETITDHFYIYLGEFQHFIGCAVVGRSENELRVSFTLEQPTEFVDVVSRLTNPLEFKGRIRPSLYGLPSSDLEVV